MEKDLVKKITTLSFLGAAGVSYLAVNVLFKSLAGVFRLVQGWQSISLLNHGIPLLAFALVFGFLQFNPKLVAWAEEVILEVSKVVWPSRKDTVAMTVVVCIFVGIASLLLIVIDFVAHNLVQLLIK